MGRWGKGSNLKKKRGANYSGSRRVPVPAAIRVARRQPAQKTLSLSYQIKTQQLLYLCCPFVSLFVYLFMYLFTYLLIYYLFFIYLLENLNAMPNARDEALQL
jgi:hypothetical protein